MKKWLKLTCVTMAMLLGMSSAMALADSMPTPEPNVMPIANGDITLSIYVGMPNEARQQYTTLADHPVVKEIAAQTGLVFDFVHPPQGDDGTFFNTTLASGQYPDIFSASFVNYPGGPEGAMDDGVLINMDELINQYAPNFWDIVRSRGDAFNQEIRGDGGAIIKFGTIWLPEFVNDRAQTGFMVRKDWMTEWGLEAPTTLDEFTELLRTFKDKGVEVPLALSNFLDTTDNVNFSNYNIIASAFGVAFKDFTLDENGKVVYTRIDPAYKEFLAYMKSLVDEGLVDRDFITRKSGDALKLFYNGRAGMTYFHSSNYRDAMAAGATVDPEFDVLPIVYPKMTADQQIHISHRTQSIYDAAWYVTSTCEHPVEAVRFIDYLHAEDTRKLTAWGLGNEEYPTYEINEDGMRVFTDFMNNNPELTDFATARALYTLSPFQVMYDNEMEMQQYGEPVRNAWATWADGTDNLQKLPRTRTKTQDEQTEFNDIMNTINTYADEMTLKMIVGDVGLDQFDAMVEQIKALNIERAIQIEQDACDRYNSRTK